MSGERAEAVGPTPLALAVVVRNVAPQAVEVAYTPPDSFGYALEDTTVSGVHVAARQQAVSVKLEPGGILVVGMMHVGEEASYRELVGSFSVPSTVVLEEGVTDRSGLLESPLSYDGMAGVLGLAQQDDLAAYLKDRTGIPFEGRHVVMSVGAGGGLNVVFKTLLDAGDEVILLAPYFVEYDFYVDNHGGRASG